MMHDIVGELSVRGGTFQPNVTLKKKKRILYPPAREGLKCFNLQYSSQLAVLPTSHKGGAALISAVKRSCEALLPLGFCADLFQFSFCVWWVYGLEDYREDLNDWDVYFIQWCWKLEALLPSHQQKLWLLKSTPPARQSCTVSAVITSFSIW